MTDNQKTSWMADFSPRQKKIVTYGITSLAICAIALLVTLMVFLGSKIITILSSALTPLVLGLFISFILNLLFDNEIMRKTRVLCGFEFDYVDIFYWLFVLVVAGCLALLAWWLGSTLVAQFDVLVSNLEKIYNGVVRTFPQTKDAIEYLKDSESLKRFILFFMGALRNVTTWLFAVFFGYCFLKHPLTGVGVVVVLRRTPLDAVVSAKMWMFIRDQLDVFTKIMTRYFPVQLVANLIEGVVGAAALYSIHLPSGLILGFLMGFLNVIPLFGTFLMLPVVLSVAYCCDGGSVNLVVSSFLMWCIVEAADLLVPPLLHKLARNTTLSAGGIVFSFLFWGALIDPVWGMILAIPLTAFSKGFLAAINAYFTEKRTIMENTK